MTACGILWLAAFPLLQGGSYSHITRDKWQAALYLTAMTAALALTGIILSLLKREKRTDLQRGPRAWVPALLLFGWIALSALCSPFREHVNTGGNLAGARTVWLGARRYEGLATQLCYLAIFLCMTLGPVRLRWISRAAAAAMLLFTGIVLLQYAGVNALALYPEGLSVRTNYEFQGTIGNIDMVSGYCTLIMGLTLGGFLGGKKPDWLLYAGGLCAVLLICCIEVQSGLVALLAGAALLLGCMLFRPGLRFRGWLALGGAAAMALARSCVAFPWLDGTADIAPAPMGMKQGLLLILLGICVACSALRRLYPGKALDRKKGFLLLAAALVLCLAVLLLLPLNESHGGLWEIQQTLLGRPQDSFGSWRLGVWRVTLEMAPEHLWLGTGPDTFWYSFNPRWARLEASLWESGALSPDVRLERFDAPHNEYLAYLANNGLPAVLFCLTLLASALALGIRGAKARPERWGLPAAALLFAVQAFFSFSIAIVNPMYWAVLGMNAAAGMEDPC